MQDKQAMDNATRRRRGTVRQVDGGQCKAIMQRPTWQEEEGRGHSAKVMGRWTRQREARLDNPGQSDKAGVEDKWQLDGGQHKERRGVEDPTVGGPDMAADDTLIGGEQRIQCSGG